MSQDKSDRQGGGDNSRFAARVHEALAQCQVTTGLDPNHISLFNLLATSHVEIVDGDTTRLVSYYDLMIRGLTNEMVFDQRQLVQQQVRELAEARKTAERLQGRLDEFKSKCTQLEASKNQQAAAYEADKRARKADAAKIVELERELARLCASLEQSSAALPASDSASGVADASVGAELESLRAQAERLKVELASANAAWEQAERSLDRVKTQAASQRGELTKNTADLTRALDEARAEIGTFRSEKQSLESERNDLARRLEQASVSGPASSAHELKLQAAEQRADELQSQFDRAMAQLEGTVPVLQDLRRQLDQIKLERDSLFSKCQQLSANAVDPKSQAAVVLAALEQFKRELAGSLSLESTGLAVCRGATDIQALEKALVAWTSFLTEVQSQAAATYQDVQDLEVEVRGLEADMELACHQEGQDPEASRSDLDRAKREIQELEAYQAKLLPLMEQAKLVTSLLRKHLAARQVCCEGLSQDTLALAVPSLPVSPWGDDGESDGSMSESTGTSIPAPPTAGEYVAYVQAEALRSGITPFELLFVTLFSLVPLRRTAVHKVVNAAAQTGILLAHGYTRHQAYKQWGDREFSASGMTRWLKYSGKPSGSSSAVYSRDRREPLTWQIDRLLSPEMRQAFIACFGKTDKAKPTS